MPADLATAYRLQATDDRIALCNGCIFRSSLKKQISEMVLRFRFLVLSLLALLSLVFLGCEKPDPQVRCPVMQNRKIEKKFFVDYQDKRIYLCCDACVKTCRKDPQKYFQLQQQWGVIHENTPTSQ